MLTEDLLIKNVCTHLIVLILGRVNLIHVQRETNFRRLNILELDAF